MHHKIFLNIILLCSSVISAMELTTTNNFYHIQNIPNELFSTAICSRLDRRARDTVRCTCKKYATLVLSQDELNNNYREACDKKDYSKMVHWASLGGLFPYQELANAVKNKHEWLAERLFNKGKVYVWDAYCKNLEEAVTTSTVDAMLPVFTWLLFTRQPKTYLYDFLRAYQLVKDAKEQDPKAQKIFDLFKKYKQEARERERIEDELLRARAKNSTYFGSGLPWHARGDYC